MSQDTAESANDETDRRSAPTAPAPLTRIAARLAVLATFIGLLLLVTQIPAEMLVTDIAEDGSVGMSWGALAACLVYAVLLAIPFVPGVEIGVALMIVVGPAMAPVVYLATLAGLCLGFGIGRLVPLRALKALATALHFPRLAAWIDRHGSTSGPDAEAAILSRTPGRIWPWLRRNRYIALALVLNLPGNSAIGGGGGIAMAAGVSRLFSPLGYVIACAVAVAPVPLAVYVLGPEALDWLSPALGRGPD